MTMPALLQGRLSIPVIAAPLFIISHPALVLAQCRAGVVGSFPSLNARPIEQLDEWLTQLTADLTPADAPYAVNLIVHRSNPRVEADLALCVKHKVPLIITSLGAREEVNAAIHSYGGIVLHDIIDDRFARKAIDKGADGLIAVAAGAGGHAGTLSPFALVQEIRQWFDGPVALSGAIATGGAVLAAQAMGADVAYIGSAFIATHEARASDAYKALQLPRRVDPFGGARSRQPARERRQRDELRRRRGQGLERHLGRGAGGGCRRRGGERGRTGGAPAARICGGAGAGGVLRNAF